MTPDEFWVHLDSTKTPDSYEHARRLAMSLSALPRSEIIDFDYHWTQARNRAYKTILWAAATLMNEGYWVSDDSFDYFRDWLVLQGRETFERAVDDPDSLAGVVRRDDSEEASFEGRPAVDAWMAATGSTWESGGWEAFVAAAEARHGNYFGVPALDEPPTYLDDDDELRRRLPRLASVYIEEHS